MQRARRYDQRSSHRTHRSDVPHEAGRLFLQALLARHGLDALVLTNEDGLLVLGAERRAGELVVDPPLTVAPDELMGDQREAHIPHSAGG